MIRRIRIRNFKCFERVDLALTSLNLLCGLNGMGKSSLIQSMLVLRQSYVSGELERGRLVLGGSLADLGTGQDVLFEDAVDDVVELGLYSDNGLKPCIFSFDYSRSAEELRPTPRRSHCRECIGHAGNVERHAAAWGQPGLRQRRAAWPTKVL